MASKKRDKITKAGLIKRKFPVVVAGFLAALAALGINKLADVNKIKNYQEWLEAHPVEARVRKAIDGDTLELEGGATVRL